MKSSPKQPHRTRRERIEERENLRGYRLLVMISQPAKISADPRQSVECGRRAMVAIHQANERMQAAARARRK